MSQSGVIVENSMVQVAVTSSFIAKEGQFLANEFNKKHYTEFMSCFSNTLALASKAPFFLAQKAE